MTRPLVGYEDRESVQFVPFPKIARLVSECTVTEKIDGTNACVIVTDDGRQVFAQSRSRIIVPGDDNFGFAAWVKQHAEQLQELGPGHHHGEWWGLGIQRVYGQTRKRFSLFNTARWGDASLRPECCDVVPVLWSGDFVGAPFYEIEQNLRTHGSAAAPGFMRPEGFVVYHHRLNAYLKHPFDKEAP